MRNARNWLWFAAQPDFADIRDQLEPIAIASGDPDAVPWWAIALGVLAVLVMIAALILWLRKRRRRRQHPQTLEERFEALRNLSPSGRELYRALHQILVDEIENRLDVRAKSRSSSELLDAFRILGIPQDGLEQFLTQADRARFSGTAPILGDGLAIEQCRRVLQQTAAISKLAVIGRTGANRDAAI